MNITKHDYYIIPESYEDYFDPGFPKYLSVILFMIGIFGNTISIIIFLEKSMRKNSTFVYLAVLCIIDLLVIIFGLGDIILISYFKLILRNKSLILCRLHTFLTYSFTHLSSFILASVSIDRAIATNLISFAKCYCRPVTALKVIIFNFILSFSINFHSLVFLGYQEPNNKTSYYCASLSGTLYDSFMNPFFQWLDLIFYAILPFIIMAICSFFIIRVIFISTKRLGKNISKTVLGENEENMSLKRRFSRSRMSRQSKRSQNHRFNKTLHLTYTLITINALFFCLVSPLAIVLVFIKGKETIEENKILINIVYLLAYSNHSFNFIFYGLSSPPYREQLFFLMGFKKKNETKSNQANNIRKIDFNNNNNN